MPQHYDGSREPVVLLDAGMVSASAFDNVPSQDTGRRLGVLGVPSSAGTHNPGQEKAPRALRAAGLVDRIAAAGVDVQDFGDLATRRHRAAERIDGVRDVERVTAVAEQTAEAVANIRASGRAPLVLGGDCTITLGVLAGLARRDDAGLIYFDGDADLNIPASSDSGVLDTMGMTHMLGGGLDSLAHLGPRHPLLRPEQVVLFGFDPEELDTGQWTRLSAQHLRAFPVSYVRDDPFATADAACRWLQERVTALLVHLDVDVLDSGAFPLANFPHFAGLTLEHAATCLTRFCASASFAGLVVTEVNPDHDPDGELIDALTETLTQPLIGSTVT